MLFQKNKDDLLEFLKNLLTDSKTCAIAGAFLLAAGFTLLMVYNSNFMAVNEFQSPNAVINNAVVNNAVVNNAVTNNAVTKALEAQDVKINAINHQISTASKAINQHTDALKKVSDLSIKYEDLFTRMQTQVIETQNKLNDVINSHNTLQHKFNTEIRGLKNTITHAHYSSQGPVRIQTSPQTNEFVTQIVTDIIKKHEKEESNMKAFKDILIETITRIV